MVHSNPKSQIPNPKFLLLWGVGFGFWGLVIAGLVPLLFGSPQPMVQIRWGAIAEPDRVALEQRWRLTEAAPRDDENLRAYVPTDTSTDTLRAIVTHPSVIDTDGINRRAFTIADAPPLTPRRGGLFDDAPAWMARGGRALAYLLAGIAGALFATVIVLALVVPLARRALRTYPAAPFQRIYTLTAGSRETLAVIALFLIAVAWRFLTFTGFSNDHYAHLAMAQQVLMGDVPIRDFADPGWPLTYTLTGLGWLVAGKDLATEWVISTAGFAVGAACTVAAGYRLSGSLAIATIVTLIEILIFPRAYSYPKVLMYAAGAWALLALAATPSRRRIVLMAAFVAIAFLFRHDHGLFLGIAAATCIALASRADGWRMAGTRIAVLTGVTAVFLLPWIVFVMLNGGLLPYLEAGLDYSRGEADATRLGSLPVSGPEAWLFWMFWGVSIVGGALAMRGLVTGRERWKGESAAVAALAVVAILVNASFLRESLAVRVSDAIVPAALLGAWLLGLCWVGTWHNPSTPLRAGPSTPLRASRLGQRAVQLATVVALVVTGIAAARVAGFAGQYEDSGIPQGLSGIRGHAGEVSQLLRSPHRQDVPSRYSLALRPFFDYVDRCTSPSDRLIVTGEFPDVLVLAGRRFAGDGIVFGSWYSSITHQDRTIARLLADPALFVLHMGDYDSFRTKYDQVDAYVTSNYRPMAEVPVDEGGTIQILVEKSRRASSVDAATGWPCFM
jgi:hypothetical protein